MCKPKLTNEAFLKAITDSFKAFIDVGTSRSTAKLKRIHGAIADDMASLLGGGYTIKAQGYDDDSESVISGRYTDKRVDVTVSRNGVPVAGIAVKFIMQNYSQNSVNYFENMLGETANIRCSRIPYFQVFIILDRLPYYNRADEIIRWETFSAHNAKKYVALSYDDTDVFMHTPNKTLIYTVQVPDCGDVTSKDAYLKYYRNLDDYSVVVSDKEYDSFGPSVILNDYVLFITKVFHSIMAV